MQRIKKYNIAILLAIAVIAAASVVSFAARKENKNICNVKSCESSGGTEFYDLTNFKTGEVYFIK